MRYFFLWLAVGWAQVWQIQALLEAKSEGPIEVSFRTPKGEVSSTGYLKGGEAEVQVSPPALPTEAVIYVPGHLPLRLIHIEGTQLDFTDPKRLHPRCAYILKGGKAALVAGELGSLPDETHPIINAYDMELFLQMQPTQSLEADFNGDGRVDEQDMEILLKNQSLLFTTEL